jgi:hypothetical protein
MMVMLSPPQGCIFYTEVGLEVTMSATAILHCPISLSCNISAATDQIFPIFNSGKANFTIFSDEDYLPWKMTSNGRQHKISQKLLV